ncbi:hypothetical protein [Ruminococcus sp. Marseille-P6503]|uniref:hypothetical protein n=1 Tax=Ruminococcus sp. Marseille-P6503 TaxID=2364796 RepID=UPI000F539249|nr:hypothetical protein [Ruminococcus sp. Marseille-P6503]
MVTDVNISEICRKAVKTAASGGWTLDYTPDSVLSLEQLLDGQSKYARESGASDIYLWNLAVVFGAYLGQTLLHNRLAGLGYSWSSDEDGVPFLKKDNDNAVYPINKVWRRLKDGESDNVRSFYDVSVAGAEGRLKPGRA